MDNWESTVSTWVERQPGLKTSFGTVFTPFENAVAEWLSRIELAPWPFQPRAVLPLLEEAGDLLGRCLAYREQAANIEERAVRAVADYELFSLLTKHDAAIADQTDSLRVDIEDIKRESLGLAAKHFENASSGRSNEINAWAARNASDLAVASRRRDALRQLPKLERQRQDIVASLQDALADRREVPGNSDNYGERIERLRDLFRTDLSEAYLRAGCAAEGLRSVYAIDNLPLPTVKDLGIGYLDELVLWIRHVYHRLDLLLQNDHEYLIRIALTRDLTGCGEVISSSDLVAGNTTGDFSFDVGENYLPFGTAPRLRGVSISVMLPDEEREKGASYCGYLVLPRQIDSFGNEIESLARVIPLGDIQDIRNDNRLGPERSALGFDANPVGRWRLLIAKPDASLNIRAITMNLRIATLSSSDFLVDPFDIWVDPYEDAPPDVDIDNIARRPGCG